MLFKPFRVYFARTSVGEDAHPLGTEFDRAFAEHGTNLPVCDLASEKFQVRDLAKVGTVWKGSFVKLRDDAPHVVAADDLEHELELEEGDRIIEKCHFQLRTRGNVLVWQNNRTVGGFSKAESYFSQCLDTTVLLPQVMNDAELERVLQGQLYELDFVYDRPPVRPDAAPQWNQNAFDMMSSVEAAHAKFTLRAPRGGGLAKNSVNVVKQLLRAHGTGKIRVRLTDETDAIELFMAPLKDRISVAMLGRYAVAGSVHEGLEEAYNRNVACFNQRD